jgi:uracil-DNA glycosylase family 4
MYQLLTEMKDCTRCGLRQGCNQVVTGVGNANASLLIVGESPGQDEDIEGEPFVGRSGTLLTKLMKDAGIERSSVYITNTVKCRPPNNRAPSPVEITICKRWLWKEIQQLPLLKVIATLGRVPTALLLQLKIPILGAMVGHEYTMDYTNAKIMPWYHPSYLLRRNRATLLEQTVTWLKSVKEKI